MKYPKDPHDWAEDGAGKNSDPTLSPPRPTGPVVLDTHPFPCISVYSRREKILVLRDGCFDLIWGTFPQGGAGRQNCWPSEGKEGTTQSADCLAEENRGSTEESGGKKQSERGGESKVGEQNSVRVKWQQEDSSNEGRNQQQVRNALFLQNSHKSGDKQHNHIQNIRKSVDADKKWHKNLAINLVLKSSFFSQVSFIQFS